VDLSVDLPEILPHSLDVENYEDELEHERTNSFGIGLGPTVPSLFLGTSLTLLLGLNVNAKIERSK